ncbi:MAG TPA: sensor histidine kinase [Flavipsychrobacter sp.]|nr:sensor histidine kinase [Flavipsychrobacter sp.]
MKTLFCHLLLIILILFKTVSYGQSNYADSMQRVINTSKNDSIKGISALKLAFHYVFNDSAKARAQIDFAMKLAREKHIPYIEVNAISLTGIFYDVQGMGDSAYAYFKKGLEVNKRYGFADMEVRLLNNLGMYSWNSGKLLEAQSYFFQALEKNPLVKDSLKRQDESTMLSNIGLIYQEQELYEKALEYHHKALSLRRQRKINIAIPTSLNNIGICYSHLDSVDKAIATYKEAMEIARKNKNERTLLDIKSNLASAYTMKGMHKESLQLHLEILEAHKTMQMQDKTIMNNEAQTAGNYIMMRDYKKAWIHMNKALKILEEKPDLKFYASSVYNFASALYYINNEPEKGLKYSLTWQELYEEEAKEGNLKKMSELEVQYETKKKEATIAAQQARIAEDQRLLAQRNMWIILTIAFALLGLISIYILQNRKRVRIEKEEERKINSAIFESEQKERIRIARDLHDSIGQKLSVMKMLMSLEHDEENKAKVVRYLDEAVTEVRTISHNLIPEVLNFGLVSALEDIADRINSTENIHVDFKADEQLQKTALNRQTELSLYRIIQEILANIIKHAQTNKILIEMKMQPQFLQIDIQDNGIGFSSNTIDESQGLGWKNIFARIKLINGDLKIQSDRGKGSHFFINIPIA